MINQVDIVGVRGLKKASITGLTPISVLVGRNGCGKSTVLDSLAIGAFDNPTAAASSAFVRRMTSTEESIAGSKWFIHTALDAASITVRGSAKRVLRFARRNDDLVVLNQGNQEIGVVSGQNVSRATLSEQKIATDVRFIDLRSRAQLRRPAHDLYSETRTGGRKAIVLALLKALLPDVEDIEILTPDNRPILFLSYADRAVPLSLSGDGIRNLVLLAFELGVRANSLILVEEPETHLHPAGMLRAAEAMVRSVRPGSHAENQLVLATHSLEFIDALVRSAQLLGALELLSVHRLSLESGEMKVSSLSGELVLDARSEAELELR